MAEERKAAENPEFALKFSEWMEKQIGIPRSVFRSRDSVDDWTYVIMMHGVLEAALNFLITTRLQNPAVSKIVARLETGDENTGKIAFIRAYELLSENSCLFIRYFGQLRNKLVHTIGNYGFSLSEYFEKLDKQQRANWGKAMVSWATLKPEEVDTMAKIALSHPREGINNSCMHVVFECLKHHSVEIQLQKEIAEILAERESTTKELALGQKSE